MRISDWSSDVCASALIGAAPDAEREHIVAIGIMPGERLVDLGEQRLDRRDVRTADAVLVDQRREGAILSAAHPFGVWRIGADAATVDLDRVEAPVGEEEADVLVGMAVEADFALGPADFEERLAGV